MRLGYACLNNSLPTNFKTCRLKTAKEHGVNKLKQLSIHNLKEVVRVINWNVQNNILFYRISSEIIPFASHDYVLEGLKWAWYKDKDILALTNEIKNKQQSFGLRLSCHPGQYTVLNSINKDVVRRAMNDLSYHNTLMNLVGGTDIILHVGSGTYGNKEEAKQRFVNNFLKLDESIKSKLRIENDDKIYTVQDVLDVYALTIHQGSHFSICLDVHHDRCNPSKESIVKLIPSVMETWKDGEIPKVHISSGRDHEKDRAHHNYILREDYVYFTELLANYEVDFMFEAKEKEKAVLRIRKFLEL